MDGFVWLDVNIDCTCEYLFLFVLCHNVMYYCTALSAVLDWICALQVFIIIIRVKNYFQFELVFDQTAMSTVRSNRFGLLHT